MFQKKPGFTLISVFVRFCFVCVMFNTHTHTHTHCRARGRSDNSKYRRTSWPAFRFIWVSSDHCHVILALAKLCVSHLVIPVSWLFICLALCSLSPRQFHPAVSPPSSSTLSSSHPPSLLQFSLVSHLLSRLPLSFRSQSVSLSLWTPVLFLSLLPVFSSPCLPLTPKRYLCLSFFCSLSLTSLCSSRSLLLSHPPLLHFSHLFCPLFSSCHLVLSSLLFLLTLSLAHLLSSSVFLCRVYISHSAFLIPISSPPSRPPFLRLTFFSPLFPLSISPRLALVFPFTTFCPPPLTDCFPPDLSLMFSLFHSLHFPPLRP